ncbi:hypothetical protein Tco_0771559 [Tanacetum coccineum]|uniref:Uncharacterized protein n=1 Tax=Tanacetum coccineum TaxID=301880 RepID=A0ABQ4ZJ49_9ASTR
MRNRINLHTLRDDSLLGTLKYVSKTEEHQVYGVVIPKEMINEDILNSTTYKTYYAYASGAKEPKKARKFKKPTSLKLKTVLVSSKEPTKKPSKKTVPLYELLEVALLKEATKRSKKDFHISQASGSGDGVGSQPKVPDESEDKTTGTNKRTSTIPGVPNVPKYQSETDDESWGDSEDDDNDDDSDDVSKGDDDEADSDDDGNDAHDSERTDSDDDEIPFITLKDYVKEEHNEEYVQSPEKYKSDDDKENIDEEEYDDLYKDVYIKSLRQINLDNVPPVVDKVASLMNIKTHHEESSTQAPLIPSVLVTVILETSTVAATTVPLLIQPFYSIPQMTTPTPVPTTKPTTTSIAVLLDFSSLFGFDQRVSALEKVMSQFKQADLSTQFLESVKSQIPTIVDDLLIIRIRYATRTTLQSYTKEFEKKAQEERKLYIDMVEKSVKDIIKNEKSWRKVNRIELLNNTRDLYDALVKSYQLDKDLFDSYGKTYSLKRGHEDKDKDEDPLAGSEQRLKKRKTSKDVEPPKGSKSKELMSSSSKGTKSQPKSSSKSVQAEEPVFETADTEMLQD